MLCSVFWRCWRWPVPRCRPCAADPWVVPADAGLAATDPDRFAWGLFVALTWPADDGQPHAGQRPALWRSRPGHVRDLGAVRPDLLCRRAPSRRHGTRSTGRHRVRSSTRSVPRQIAMFRDVSSVKSGSVSDEQEEVRLNRADLRLHPRQRPLFGRRPAVVLLQPPADRLSRPAPSRSRRCGGRSARRTRRAISGRSSATPRSKRRYLYGLTALHIVSKVLPHWLWATFEHVDNPYRAGPLRRGLAQSVARQRRLSGRHSSIAIASPPASAWKARAGKTTACAAPRSTMPMPTAIPLILANSELETGFQQSSSCMSCHVRSTIGPNRNDAASFVFDADSKEHPPARPAPMRLPRVQDRCRRQGHQL